MAGFHQPVREAHKTGLRAGDETGRAAMGADIPIFAAGVLFFGLLLACMQGLGRQALARRLPLLLAGWAGWAWLLGLGAARLAPWVAVLGVVAALALREALVKRWVARQAAEGVGAMERLAALGALTAAGALLLHGNGIADATGSLARVATLAPAPVLACCLLVLLLDRRLSRQAGPAAQREPRRRP
jgi:hypothetical protein